jgi:hypothetical protein
LPLLGLAQRLDEITGVGLTCAHVIIAELGTDVTAQFPTAAPAAWAKLTPLTDQSGATTRPGKTGKGNRWLRGALGAAAMACAKSKGTFLGQLRCESDEFVANHNETGYGEPNNARQRESEVLEVENKMARRNWLGAQD